MEWSVVGWGQEGGDLDRHASFVDTHLARQCEKEVGVVWRLPVCGDRKEKEGVLDKESSRKQQSYSLSPPTLAAPFVYHIA